MKITNKFKMKRVNKNILAIVISVALALLCAVILKVIVDNKISDSLDQETVSYIVANADLAAGSIVDPFDQSLYAIRSDIPAEFAQSNAITPNQADTVNGALLLGDLKRGDILTWQTVDTDERRQLASRLLPGRRALTIPVDDQSSISSMLNPNDKIDLILTYQKKGNVIAAPLLQNVRVLATGDSMSVSGNYAEDDGYSDGFSTITIDLSIDDVSKVTTALELGRLSAVLRNPNDLSYTVNVVSLKTLQRELTLQNYQEPESITNEALPSAYDKQLDELERMRETLLSDANSLLTDANSLLSNANNREPLPSVEKPRPKPSIDVVYGNRSAGANEE